MMHNVEATGAARLHRAASVSTAELCILLTLKLWEVRVKIRDCVIDWLTVNEAAGWLDVTPDSARRLLMPTDIERTKLGKKIKVTVRQMIVDPVC